MYSLKLATISTLAFYDAIGELSVTSLELYRGLLKTNINTKDISYYDFLKNQHNHKQDSSSPILCYRGLYFLKKNKFGYNKRINQGKTGINKWHIAQSMTKAISFLPFVRMIAVTGSLALNNTRQESDIDVLIVAKKGYIWTTRVLVSFLMQILGKRRHGVKITDRICLNHYLADSNLSLRPKNLFSAHICASFIPLWDKNHTSSVLLRDNSLALESSFVSPHDCPPPYHLKTLHSAPLPHRLFTNISELFIENTMGRFIETAMKSIQVRRIKKTLTNNHFEGQEVIFDDEALVFHHPRPANQEALYLFSKNLETLNLPGISKSS